MKETHAAAMPYARALYALAKERNLTEQVGREVRAVADVIGEPEIRKFFGLPWVSPSAKRGAATEAAGRLNVSPLTRDFLVLIAGQGRVDQVGAIADAFQELLDEDRGIVRGRVRTAIPLSTEQRQALSERLSRELGGKRVELEEVQDTTLLGGFVAEIGTFIADGSLDGQLVRLKERLAKG